MKYVMSDIHGNYEKFIQMLKLLNFKDYDELYILGDIIDRGVYGIKLLEYIMHHSNIHLIRGNHEELLLRYLTASNPIEEEDYLIWWLENGGAPTIKSLINLDRNEIDDIIEYISNTQDYIILDDRFILTHAGFSVKVTSLDQIEMYPRKLIFSYDRDFPYDDNKYLEGYTVVLGHIITSSKRIEHNNEGKILIDCGCGYSGQLGCLCLDNFKEYYI